MTFIISVAPVTKKNSQQIRYNSRTGKRFIAQSDRYKEYEDSCGYFLRGKGEMIDYPVNVKAVYYMPSRRRVDLCNLHEALHDILVKYQVLSDDNYKIIQSTDGSRVFYDKDNPRTEVTITRVKE